GLAHGRRARPRRGAPVGHLQRRRHRAVHARGAQRSRPHRRLPRAREPALPRRDRPRHVRADRLRHRGLGRRADLHRRPCVDGAADALRAGRGQGARAHRRRHRLDHEPRRRRRGRREVRRRRQPARPVRQRLLQAHGRPVRLAAAAGERHGPPADRLPDVQAHGLPATARDGAKLGGALPRRRHRPDRARAQRRADVPDVDHELHQARADRQARLPVGDAQAGRGLRVLPRGRRAPRHRDLRHARAQGRQALLGRAREDPRVAQDPRADDRRAPAPVGQRV
ncbi:MAG: hypothetical protein AVDCRST_MAG85-1378, partial [uncultured Solirubrobacteraceae bacterium]